MSPRLRTAVLPVAGLGTRFLPATKSVPKEMLPVVDKPLIQYAVEEALSAGIETIVLVTGRGKSAVEDHFDHAFELKSVLEARGKIAELGEVHAPVLEPGKLICTRQQEPLGLGHAIWCAREIVGDEPFAVILPDDLVLAETPCLKQMAEVHQSTNGSVVAVMDVPREHTNRYGILDVGNDDGKLAEVTGLVEKPAPEVAPSTLSIIGRYILLPEIFEHLERGERGVGGEIQLTDAMTRLLGNSPFHGFRFDGRRYDCGDKVGFLEANLAFALARDDLRSEVQAMLKSYR